MYDIEIFLPACFKGKYGERMECFKKYGLLGNLSGHRVKLVLGLKKGSYDVRTTLFGWPKHLHVEVFETYSDTPAPKVYQYYDSLKKLDAKWYMRIDDDSITHVERLLKGLLNINNNEKHYFTTDTCIGDIGVEEELLNKHNLPYTIFQMKHEIEASIMSNACVRAILDNETAKMLIKERLEIWHGYTDILMSYCSKFCSIYPARYHRISQSPLIVPFMKEDLDHIHYLSKDVNSETFKIIQRWIDGKEVCDPRVINTEINIELKCKKDSFDPVHNRIVLKENNGVGVIESRDEDWNLDSWVSSGSELLFFSKEGHKSHTFYLQDGKEDQKGKCHYSKDIIPSLNFKLKKQRTRYV